MIKTAALLLALAVILGAFGAHGLRPLLDASQQATYETSVRYHFYHAFALLAAGILFKDFSNNYIRWAGRFFGYGILIFSGSLYLLTVMHVLNKEGFNWLGAITPIGGLCFIAGWLSIFLGARRNVVN